MMQELFDNPEVFTDIQSEEKPNSENENPTGEYQFADGYLDPDDSLNEFLDDFKKSKEESGVEEVPDAEEFEVVEDPDDISAESAKYTADFITGAIDEIAARALSFYSKQPVDEHRAGAEQKKHLKKLWTQFCKEKAIEIPVTAQIAVTMISVYGSQIPAAMEARKRNLQLERIKEEQERLSYDRKLLDRELEQFNYMRRQRNG